MTEFKLIVAGGRDFMDYQKLSQVLFDLSSQQYADKAVSIVSGMAKGADALGVRFAKEHGVTLYKYPADWSLGKSAGFRRNEQMGQESDGLVAFWDGHSSGTKHMIDYMQQLNKPVHVVSYIAEPMHEDTRYSIND